MESPRINTLESFLDLILSRASLSSGLLCPVMAIFFVGSFAWVDVCTSPLTLLSEGSLASWGCWSFNAEYLFEVFKEQFEGRFDDLLPVLPAFLLFFSFLTRFQRDFSIDSGLVGLVVCIISAMTSQVWRFVTKLKTCTSLGWFRSNFALHTVNQNEHYRGFWSCHNNWLVFTFLSKLFSTWCKATFSF